MCFANVRKDMLEGQINSFKHYVHIFVCGQLIHLTMA